LKRDYGIELIAPNRENRSQTQDGRKLRRYKRRWCVERLFAWLQWFRRLVTRYEYHIENYLGMVRLGCMRIMLRYFVSDYSYRSATMGSTFAARRAGT
jgi:transposase